MWDNAQIRHLPVFLLLVALLVRAAIHSTGSSAAEISCPDCTYKNAYAAAKVYGSSSIQGLIVHLHDCRGRDVDNGWQRKWLDYLNLNGFVVVSINSFADDRPPPAACHKDPWQHLYKKVEIYGIRKLQAEYAVRQIRVRYPDKRIFVWGHAEGGVTAQLIAEEIDGVITTGATCSSEWLEGMADTPLLVIQGTEDAKLKDARKGLLYDTLDDRCKIHMTDPKWEWLTVEGMGDAAELSRNEVKRRIAKFLGILHTE